MYIMYIITMESENANYNDMLPFEIHNILHEKR